MAKQKKSTRVPLAPHQTALPANQRLACTEQYIRIGKSFLENKTVQSLPPSAFVVLIYMLASAGNNNHFSIYPGHIKGMSKTTFYSSIKILEVCGFITITRRRMPGSSNRYQFFTAPEQLVPWHYAQRMHKNDAFNEV